MIHPSSTYSLIYLGKFISNAYTISLNLILILGGPSIPYNLEYID
jgi:NADH:ubiquinone oxidoreductase subunit H